MNQKMRKQWIITTDEPPAVIRRCSRCGRKNKFKNSGKFRVNANGRILDVWLIYRCEKCETSWNMTIWERVEAGSLDETTYKGFLNNDPGLADRYGRDQEVLVRNKAEVCAASGEYHVEVADTLIPYESSEGMEVEVRIPAGFELRIDTLLARQLSVSRNRIKLWWEEGLIVSKEERISLKNRVKDLMVLQIKETARN